MSWWHCAVEGAVMDSPTMQSFDIGMVCPLTDGSASRQKQTGLAHLKLIYSTAQAEVLEDAEQKLCPFI